MQGRDAGSTVVYFGAKPYANGKQSAEGVSGTPFGAPLILFNNNYKIVKVE